MSLEIQSLAVPDIVGDVGDSHPEAPAAGTLALTEYGIIKVTRILTIDRHQGQLAQIKTPHLGLFRDLFGQILDLIKHFGRPDMRNAIVANGHLDLHTRIHVVTQHLEDLPHRIHATRWALGNTNHDHLTLTGPLVHARRNQNILADTAVIRHDETDIVFNEEAANNIHVTGLQQPNQARLSPSARIQPRRLHQYIITV